MTPARFIRWLPWLAGLHTKDIHCTQRQPQSYNHDVGKHLKNLISCKVYIIKYEKDFYGWIERLNLDSNLCTQDRVCGP